jgi:hypothetical protein
MNLDLGSPFLDVAFALAFVFFLLSVIVSAVTELIAWFASLRSRTLESGIKGLLGEDFGKELIGHPLVQSEVRQDKSRRFSYLSSRNFGLALVDLLGGGAGEGSQPAGLRAAIDARPDGALKAQLHALGSYGGGYDLTSFRRSAEHWFDEAMERVSGWYKRRAQTITVVTAVAVAVGLNVNAVRVADRLANDETVRNVVVQAGDKFVAQTKEGQEAEKGEGEGAEGKSGSEAPSPGGKRVEAPGCDTCSNTTLSPTAAGKLIDRQISDVSALSLPVGWESGFSVTWEALAGWLITALAISLGAPFWFDALGKLARLRTSGEKPEATSARAK